MSTKGPKRWLKSLRSTMQLNWDHWQEMAQQVRGIMQDREGKWYWRYVYEYSPNHFNISFHLWSGLTFSQQERAGWIAVGMDDGEDF